ncbi:hypothetical protein SAMN05216189_1003206 [Pseudomonas delhiensis]|uniref:Response regulatory domain-containing protein n=2 Tax=Pseudomonas delhiensis TaxID=366289 RepID=A0A239LVJ9_9PSED|nr:hypothetical protein SAMN05216189_1003206 [Pseudomonas delhiensis]SNT33898.1 hypothetical protein SAMN06295949_12211 [Pseudomonas delhiensis]
MHRSVSKTLILCENAGNIIEYTRMMNVLGFFSLTLCANVKEALSMVREGRSFDYMIYDDFSYGVRGCMEVKELGRRIQHIILLADVTETRRLSMLRWAWVNKVPLLGLLPRPMNIYQLENLMSFHHRVRDIAEPGRHAAAMPSAPPGPLPRVN